MIKPELASARVGPCAPAPPRRSRPPRCTVFACTQCSHTVPPAIALRQAVRGLTSEAEAKALYTSGRGELWGSPPLQNAHKKHLQRGCV